MHEYIMRTEREQKKKTFTTKRREWKKEREKNNNHATHLCVYDIRIQYLRKIQWNPLNCENDSKINAKIRMNLFVCGHRLHLHSSYSLIAVATAAADAIICTFNCQNLHKQKMRWSLACLSDFIMKMSKMSERTNKPSYKYVHAVIQQWMQCNHVDWKTITA